MIVIRDNDPLKASLKISEIPSFVIPKKFDYLIAQFILMTEFQSSDNSVVFSSGLASLQKSASALAPGVPC